MERVNDCSIIKDIKESGTINYYSFKVNTNENQYGFYKYGEDDFEIYDSDNNQMCFTVDSLQKTQFDYEKEGSKRMKNNGDMKKGVNPKSLSKNQRKNKESKKLKKDNATAHQNIKMMKNVSNVKVVSKEKPVVNKQSQAKLLRFRKNRRTQRK